jgi:two-component system sensor histidine kinase VicK
VEQVLRILLDNAIKYTPPGGSIAVHARHKGGDVVIEVRDTGIGIPEREQSLVFERFYRADPARQRSGGFGLGLPIARELTRSMGGTIRLDSAPGAGTAILLTFPASRAPEPPASAV